MHLCARSHFESRWALSYLLADHTVIFIVIYIFYSFWHKCSYNRANYQSDMHCLHQHRKFYKLSLMEFLNFFYVNRVALRA